MLYSFVFMTEWDRLMRWKISLKLEVVPEFRDSVLQIIVKFNSLLSVSY